MSANARLESAARAHPFVSASGIAATLTLFSDVVVAILYFGDALGGTGLIFFMFALIGTAWLISALAVRLLDGLDGFDREGSRPTGLVAGITAVEVVAALVLISPLLSLLEFQIVTLLGAGITLAIASLSRASLVFFETDHPQWYETGAQGGR